VYYGACNYFQSTTKFRMLGIQPEGRYWFSAAGAMQPGHVGPFIGAHLGLAWYNLSLGGDYRIQDHAKNSPAYGGGLNVGYRFNLSRDHRWTMEMSVGAGVYRLHYDRYLNSGCCAKVGSREKTWLGVDNVGVTVGYSINTKSKD
jgi:hypothetical protein